MKLLTIAVLSLALASCSGSAGIPDSNGQESHAQCSVQDMNAWVLENMQDYYLFYGQLPNANPSAYSSPEDYVRALRVAPFDRYSYVADAATNTALFEQGKRFGFGMRIRRTDDDRLLFSLIEPKSPLGFAGIERGDQILAINNVTPENFTAEFINGAFGVGNQVVDIDFTVRTRATGATRTVTVTKTQYEVQSVLDTEVFTENNKRIGYLNFLTFLETSVPEIDTAIASLASQNIDELVLDLRHNLGGRISVAEQLASQIAGQVLEGSVFTQLTFNDKYTNQNSVVPFSVRSNTLNLPRVYVLTSPETCSSSEMVINSLRPFIEVITVGDTTCGKPYGTLSRERCGKSLNALEVEFVNHVLVGGYYDGIAATCPAQENLSEVLGDTNETLLRTAINHSNTGQCTSVGGPFADVQPSAQGQYGDTEQGVTAVAPAMVVHTEGPELLNPSFDEIRTLYPQ